MVIASYEWRRGTFLIGVALTEINQPWLVNISVLYDLGYFDEVADDYLIVISINWEIIYSVKRN